MSKNAQGALRYVIEKSTSNCRLLFTANAVHKLDPAIHSWLLLVNFDVNYADQNKVVDNLFIYYERHLTELGIKFESQGLRKSSASAFPTRGRSPTRSNSSSA